MNVKFSVAIPLYNKEKEIAAAIDSVLAQTISPLEIIVIDDGSTDGSAAIVQGFGSPLIKLISQPNSGVAVTRNNAAKIARGEWLAFLDADDTWESGYLEKIAGLIENYPGCGAYSTAFNIISNGKVFPNRAPDSEGIVKDFFCLAMTKYICQPSATVISKEAFTRLGGFPAGMKLGEDLYFWIKLATDYPVCFTPSRLVNYNRTASNRSAGIYTPESTVYSFEDLYIPEDITPCRNEFIARCAIGKALTLTAKGDTEFGRRTEQFFSYTRMYRRGWRKLYWLNRLPVSVRPSALRLYDRMAWMLARKGL